MIGILFLTLVAASVAALNPATFGVLIMLISTILGRGRSTKRMIWLSLSFVLALFTLSMLIGFGVLYLFNVLPLPTAQYVTLLIGLAVVAAGLIELKDYFWYGAGLSLRIGKNAAGYIRTLLKRDMSLGRVLWLGFFVAVVTLPCVSAPYLAMITMLHGSSSQLLLPIVLYNVVFILPLLLLITLVASGVKINTIQQWKEETKGRMRLGVGLIVIVLGWIILLIANGVLNFG